MDMPGRRCDQGCTCKRHGGGVKPTPEEARERRRQVQAESWRRWSEADPEGVRAGNRERNARYRENHRDEVLERGRQWRDDNPEASWEHSLWYRHKMTAADWQLMWDQQMGRCYLCLEPLDGTRPRAVHIDHDHGCCQPTRSCAECRRGLAHSRCNRLLSWAGDDPEWLRRVADHLEAANRRVRSHQPVQALIPLAGDDAAAVTPRGEEMS